MFGAGAEGRSFAGLVAGSVAELIIVDDNPDALPVGHLEVGAPDSLEQRRVDFVVRSPGVSRYDERVGRLSASGAVVTTPTALWLEDFHDRTIVAVTGSKGKSTTATLTAAVLSSMGIEAVLAGNIGRPLSDLYSRSGESEVFVVELSSFQTADVTVSPTIGVLTSLAPDHLDWHRDLEQYYADKLRIFSRREGVPVAVNATSAEALARTADLGARVPYGAPRSLVALRDGNIVIEGRDPLDLSAFGLLGEHNLVNACGAITAAMLLTGRAPEPSDAARALCETAPLRSRLQTVGARAGVEYVDDALGSNPEATIAALKTFAGRQIALVAGGHSRGLDYGPLAAALAACVPRPFLVLLGDAGDALAAALGNVDPRFESVHASTLETAVKVAREAITPVCRGGSAVMLFSPGAPTPKAEGSYLDRSERFREASGVGR